MAIEEIQAKNGVRHVRETQREYHTSCGAFVPPSKLAEIARALTSKLNQKEVARDVGISQSRVSEAVNAKNPTAARNIISHYAEEADVPDAEGPLFRVPSDLSDLASTRSETSTEP